MSENLIYGADITAYGAVADGVTDCSDAFIKAIENGESLIVVPYGKYVIKKALKLTSNLKIQLHANAEIIFDTKAKTCISASDCSSLIISGGSFMCDDEGKTFLSLCGCSYVKISDCTISASGGVALKNCENVSLKNVGFDIDGDCISLRGKNEEIYMRNVSAFSCVNVIDIDEGAEAKDLYIDGINLSDCKHLIGIYSGKLEEARITDVEGDFSDSLIFVSDEGALCDADIDEVCVYCNSTSGSKYFDLIGNIDGLEITNFKRNSDFEARPFIPTLILKPQEDSTAIIDGMLLDNVINARALSKTIKMTTARLTNPTGKFIYTLECGIDKGDALTIPLGDFDSLTVYTK